MWTTIILIITIISPLSHVPLSIMDNHPTSSSNHSLFYPFPLFDVDSYPSFSSNHSLIYYFPLSIGDNYPFFLYQFPSFYLFFSSLLFYVWFSYLLQTTILPLPYHSFLPYFLLITTPNQISFMQGSSYKKYTSF
jgi:hypothetical protein